MLETRAIDDTTFRAAPAESNRIWIGGKPMEEWLGAQAGNSPGSKVCDDLPCRAIELHGQTCEASPEDLIVKAAIIAASQLIAPGATTSASSSCSTSCGCRSLSARQASPPVTEAE